MKGFLLIFFTAALIFLYACNKRKPAEAAFFIKTSGVSVNTSAGQGSRSHKITDLWLYVNDKFQGVFPSENLLPIVSGNKKARISIFAGIKNNGISTTRMPYPFIERLDIDTLAENGSTITTDLTFKYYPTTTFTWTENFDESTGYTLIKSNISDTTFSIASDADSFEGKSMYLTVPNNGLIAQVESAEAFELPKNSPNVYLEFNYKCNQEFSIGVIMENSQLIEAIIVNPQKQWNKIYIQLASVINNPSSRKHKVYFKIVKRDVTNPELFLDNIKLLYL